MGPYEMEEARQLRYSGMLRDNDLAWLEGTPEWVPLATLLAAPTGPPPFAPASTPTASIPNNAPGYPYQGAPTSGLAVSSLVLGILSLLGCLIIAAIPAVICGHVALSGIRRSQGCISGDGLAWAGLIMGYTAIAITALVFFAMVSIPAFAIFMESVTRGFN